MKNKGPILFFLAMALLSSSCVSLFAQDKIFSRTVKRMGSRFQITLVCSAQEAPQLFNAALAEIGRIEREISSWDPHSQTSKINLEAGVKPVQVSKELFGLIQRSLSLSKLTAGAFDISYAAIDPVWFFDGSMTAFPTQERLAASVKNIGYANIVLDAGAQTVFLKKKGMKIGFGAIGKGFAADQTKTLLIKKGVTAGIINAAGDLTTWGVKPDGTDWQVGISHPENPTKVFSWFPVKDAAVATSGNYEKYVTLKGKRYSHIIDPRTGIPVSGIKSVSVFAPKAELADALATAVFIVGLDTGLDLIAQLPGVSCIVVDAQNKIHYSNNITVAPVKIEG